MSSAQSNLTPPAAQMQFVETLLPQVQTAVRRACHKHRHQAAQDEIEELSQQIILLLMENDCRRLRSFEHQSSFQTWLRAVVRNHVSNRLQRQKEAESLEALALESMIHQPIQEAELMAAERRKHLRAAIAQLTLREQQILGLCFGSEVNTAVVAALMGTSVGMIYQHKHRIIAKLRKLLTVEPGS